MMRVLAAVAVVAFTLVAPAPAIAQDDDIPDDCRTIVGCADAGPEPETPGDRGGWAQLMTLGVLVVAISFIVVKVIRSARGTQRARDAQSAS